MGLFTRRKATPVALATPEVWSSDETAADSIAATTAAVDAASEPDPASPLGLALAYATSCDAVVKAASTCLDSANTAIGARNMAAQRPQHEASIANFTSFAEKAEREFAAQYPTFDQACAKARVAARDLLAAPGDNDPEIVLFTSGLGEERLDEVAKAKRILRSRFRPTPQTFTEGIAETNRLLNDPDPEGGNIYRPRAPSGPRERPCPWCAEAIELDALSCQYCGNDAQAPPNSM